MNAAEQLPRRLRSRSRPVNDPPVANDSSFNTPEDVAITDSIDASDPDVILNGDELLFTLVSGPVNGNLELDPQTGDFTYTPDTGYNGSDNFTVNVSDKAGEEDQAVVSLYINYYENDPEAYDDWYTIDEDSGMTSFDVMGNDVDGDIPYGDELHLVSITSSPLHGSAVINPLTKEIEYTAAANYNGTDSFTYQNQR